MPTRAISRVRAQFGGALLAATVVGLAPAGAAAQPLDAAVAAQKQAPSIRSLTGVPARVETGDSFRVRVKVRNTRRRAIRPRVTISLRSRRNGSGRRVGAERFSRIQAGKSGTERIRVRIPRGLEAGRYYVVACIGRNECRVANRRIRVTRPTTPPPNPNPVPNPPPSPNPPNARFTVLVLTETDAGHGATSAGVEAVRALGRQRNFAVSVTDESAGVFTEANLKLFRAVIFLDNAGTVLTGAEKAAFEAYYEDGGGMLAVHGAIDAEPEWEFFTELLGTRADGESETQGATIKVADRGHDASKELPERWQHTDAYPNFADNVRGESHVLATVDETTYEGGDMGADHPFAWCKDYQGGRSFYTAAGHTAASYADPNLAKHLGGAIDWTAGTADPVYSDCGATVLANYQQTKVSAPPNINEPIGFDQLPDGRLIQTVRDGRVRLHDPASGTSSVIATLPVYTHSEDGLYGPAVDNDFATNKWVYLYYSPLAMEGTSSSGTPYPATTPPGAAPTTPQASLSAWDDWKGYFQLSRFKFVDGATPSLDLGSEQKIMKVEVNRGACCHVGGDIDFDKHNNLWLVTGDDTPAGGGNSGGWGPFNDLKTDETQTVRTLNATGGTFTITFAGQTTAPIAYDANSAAVQSALDALSDVEPGDITVNCGNNACTQPTQLISTTLMTLVFDGQYAHEDVPEITTDATALTGTTPTAPVVTAQQANLFIPPWFDARRGALSTNDLRGKMLRIKVNEDGSYASVPGNLFTGAEGGGGKTRSEIYAMGFRNPFRIQVDSDDVAYTTDYSPDSQVPGPLRGPAGTGRMEIVRAPANYGWPLCMTPTVPMYEWNFNTSRTFGEPYACSDPTQGPVNASQHNTGLTTIPPITQPDLWYSYQDPTWGTPCFEGYNTTVARPCVNLFPELATGGVGPHGAARYEYDPANPNPTKFPPYYDDAVFFGEFTRDTLKEIRLDANKQILKINPLLNCGAVGSAAQPFECDNPMDLQFGADGAFYLLTYGDGFFAANPDAGMYKWEYVKGQRAPQAVLGATPTDGPAPLTVAFSSEGSRDPDPSDSIEFAWDFTNDGTVDSTDPNPTFTYTQNGVYTARLTVADSSGKTATQTTTITVGNTSPQLQLVSPVDGDFFAWGDDVPFTVTGTDAEDGPIDCSRVVVTFVLVHDQHGHGEDSQTGCTGTLSTDADDASHGGYIAGGISVSYTDEGANGQPPLTTTVQNVLQIRRQQLEYAQDQNGTTVGNAPGTEPDPGGGQIRNGLDDGDYIGINRSVNLTNMDDQITFRFAANGTAGTDRAQVEIHLDSPDGPLATTVTLQNTGGNTAYTSQTFPLAFTGSRRVFLVFRAIAGNPTTGNFGNLNWVEFSGPGHGVPPTP